MAMKRYGHDQEHRKVLKVIATSQRLPTTAGGGKGCLASEPWLSDGSLNVVKKLGNLFAIFQASPSDSQRLLEARLEKQRRTVFKMHDSLEERILSRHAEL